MKLIVLSLNRVACVDDEDFKWLLQWNWYYHHGERTGYAERHDNFNPRRVLIPMQVAIMKHHKRWKRGKEVDHINTCGCDNRKVNLRLATRSEQKVNQRPRSTNTSGVTGVHWHTRDSKWVAQIRVNGKLKHLGNFVNKGKAIKKRREAEIKYFGEYCYNPTKLCPLWKTNQCPECSKRAKELGLKP